MQIPAHIRALAFYILIVYGMQTSVPDKFVKPDRDIFAIVQGLR